LQTICPIALKQNDIHNRVLKPPGQTIGANAIGSPATPNNVIYYSGD
jgi:2,4-dienoyl-CoA reductase-like NADH-dependent reductase (Old Yellow Enzyme family)